MAGSSVSMGGVATSSSPGGRPPSTRCLHASAQRLIGPDGRNRGASHAKCRTYYKYGETPGNDAPHWYAFDYDPATGTGAEIFDDDTTPNGVIADPGAPAVLVPLAAGDAYNVREDGVLSVPAAGVLANDTNPSGLPLTAVLVRGPAHGRLTLSADGGFRYVPAADFHGTDTFTYRARGGMVESAVTAVTITVTPVTDARIDVRRNRIVLASGGMLRVVIGGETVDARAVVRSQIRFGDPSQEGRVTPVRCRLVDQDRDGHLDLVVDFSLRAIRRARALRADSTEAMLTGLARTPGGELLAFEGRDSVRVAALDTVFRLGWRR